jgi:hypothetical protein
MRNVVATGHENNRSSTKSFSAWLEKINQGREKNLFGIDKYIVSLERNGDVISISTLNGSVYTITCSEKSYKDLKDLVGYKVTFYPKEYSKYELEAYFIWNWDDPVIAHSFGYLVVNRVTDVKRIGKDGLIVFENGDALPVPFKDHEKPYVRASKRLHGDDISRDGYAIDFDKCMQDMREKFTGEYVVYSTRLSSIDAGSYSGDLTIYRESPYKEHAERDKFLFRQEYGVIQSFGTWDSNSVPIYLEDGRIMTFSFSDYSRHLNGECENNIVHRVKKDLETEIGKLYKFLVVYGGDIEESQSRMNIVSLKRVDDGEPISKSNPPISLDSDWRPRSSRI